LFPLALLSVPGSARAGIPECRNLRLEDVASGACELRGTVECDVDCSRFGIYEKACATRLQPVCREECTLPAQPTCTDECTESCTAECDRGVSITCIHNCFGECVGSCDASCEGSADPGQCRATCEANCDGECDIQCRPVVDGDCYEHCVECCGGSCRASANMQCQTTCQDEEFETCEHELEVECSGSCSADGALFCNGQYMLSGPELGDCVDALIARGSFDANVSAQVGLGNLDSSDVTTDVGCSMAPGAGRRGGALAIAALLPAMLAAGLRRRKRVNAG
jgi:hypothetical protein